MSLSSSMFAGITGLQAHGERMGVIGNNISNMNTIGFKAARMQFEDTVSQDLPTANSVGQIGRGVQIASIYTDFGQGSFQSTSESTDLAIGGNGFFIVSPKSNDERYYTRAGNFRFDREGYLVDPRGNVVQGWQVDQQSDINATTGTVTQSSGVSIIGTPGDIRLNSFTSDPRHSTRVSLAANLSSSAISKSRGSTVDIGGNTVEQTPLTSLFHTYDNVNNSPPLSDAQYGYQNTIKVFDERGVSHDLTVYFDKAGIDDGSGRSVWEFTVAVDPNDDQRRFWDDPAFAWTANPDAQSKRGMLMTGTITFGSAGQVESMTAYTLQPNTTPIASGGPYDPALALDEQASGVYDPGDPSDPANWKLADFSKNGFPILTANFTNASTSSGMGAFDFSAMPDAHNVELDFGISNHDLTTNGGWANIGATGSLADLESGSFIQQDADADGNVDPFPITSMPKMNNVDLGSLKLTSTSGGSTTLYQSQDGYTSGILQGVNVTADGVVTGRYSNGQIIELFSLTLAEFNNQWGLRREGGNLFSETLDSGQAITGQANQGGKGSIASNSLEQSNVDLASEFVDMITTQRGFQANGKTITTVDSMLQEVIQLKR